MPLYWAQFIWAPKIWAESLNSFGRRKIWAQILRKMNNFPLKFLLDIRLSSLLIIILEARTPNSVANGCYMDFCVGLIDSLRMKGLCGLCQYRVLYRHVRQVLYHYQKTRPEFVWRRATTVKLPVPEGLLKEIILSLQREIHPLVKNHNIPDSLVINHDQTPLTYVSVSTNTLAPDGAKVIGVRGTKD